MSRGNDKSNLLLLFERPQEPVFMEKGTQATVFDVPDKFLTDRYRPIGNAVQSRFGEKAEKRVPVKDIAVPDLRNITTLGRREPFSLFIPRHRRIAANLIDIFVAARTVEDVQSIAVFARDRVNPYLFNYAFSVPQSHKNHKTKFENGSVEIMPADVAL